MNGTFEITSNLVHWPSLHNNMWYDVIHKDGFSWLL